MKDLKDAIQAILLIGFAIGIISFMFTVGTLMAPIAVVLFSVVSVFILIRESEKKTKKKKK